MRRSGGGKKNAVACVALAVGLLVIYSLFVLEWSWTEESRAPQERREADMVRDQESESKMEYWMGLEEELELVEELEEEREEELMELQAHELLEAEAMRDWYLDVDNAKEDRPGNAEEYTWAEEEEEEEREEEALLELREREAEERIYEEIRRDDYLRLEAEQELEESLRLLRGVEGGVGVEDREWGGGDDEYDEEAWKEAQVQLEELAEELELVVPKEEATQGYDSSEADGNGGEGRVMQFLPFPEIDSEMVPNFTLIPDREPAWPFVLPTEVSPPSLTGVRVRKEELEPEAITRRTPLHRVWQIAIPNTATSTFEIALRQGVAMDTESRFCTGSEEVVLADSCPLEIWKFLTNVAVEQSSGGHADWSRWNDVLEGLEYGAYGMMMMRDPGNYMWKMFYDGAPDKPKFDYRFVDEFQLSSKLDVSFDDFIGMAYYKWNFWTRALAADFYPRHSTIDTRSDDITLERALLLASEGIQSPLFLAAWENLNSLHFLGMYHRLEETIELLYYTFCFNEDLYPFNFSPRSHSAFPEITLEQQILLEEVHALDYRLFRHAEQVFEERMEQMRREKAQGFQCNYLLRGCAVSCP